MRVLITGGAGMLGRDVARAAELAGHEPIAVSHQDLDVTDEAAVRRTVKAERPEAIVNCAAWTDVDGAEADPDTALEVNGRGAGNIARVAHAAQAALLHTSTDYVFDGRKPEPYIESDPPDPLSAYGRSKLAGEVEVTAAAPGATIVRSSWLFGTGGRNFAETILSLGAQRPELSVVDDQIGCPTFTGHLAEAIVEFADGHAPGIHHIAAGGAATWFQFAVEILREAGIDSLVKPWTTEELGRPAPRPANSRLRSERADTRFLPDWHDGLAAFLAERTREQAMRA